MSATRRPCLGALIACVALAAGCANKPLDYDYSAFQRAKPASLLVLPPVSESTDIKAPAGVWSHATRPLAEAGYYVLPVALVDETFRQNGISTANEAQEIPYQRLREVFGADAAVYLRVKKYGTSYKVIISETQVEVDCRIVDLRSGSMLWQGSAFATSAELPGQVGLVAAAVNQIVGTATDAAFVYAAIANQRLMGAPRYNGVLPGPRSPLYGQPPRPQ